MNHTYLNESYQLEAKDIKVFKDNGFVCLRNILNDYDLLNYFRDRILKRIEENFALRKKLQAEGKVDDYNAFFTQITNLWLVDEEIKKFTLAKRFGEIAAKLLGVEGIRLYHDQALIKEPGGKATPWHRDQYYWPLETKNTITMWMPLVDVNFDMGTMNFASGSHLGNTEDSIPISSGSDQYYTELLNDKNYHIEKFELKAGDATFHYGNTIHSADANISKNRREIMTVIYYEDGIRISEPKNSHQKVDLETFHPDLNPGDIAAGKLNPKVF